jgi:hypothetical protein
MALAAPFEPIEVTSDIRSNEAEAYTLRSYRVHDRL